MTGALEAWDYLTGALVRKIKPADAIGEEEDLDDDQSADGWMITELCASEIEPCAHPIRRHLTPGFEPYSHV
eukprot:m.495424 g.495424  ORF g.495424 m.495424 type:complete len:72 (-) comp57300_c2_seq6:628-843(-)